MLRSSRIFLAMMLLISGTVQAGVSIGGSRVVFPGDKREQTISVKNMDASPYLIQSWVEDDTGKVDGAHFILTPPLFRLDSGDTNVLRIVKLANNFPGDKETLFWLNIKSIPGAKEHDENTLQIAVRTRMKLIFRPAALADTLPETQAEKVKWTETAGALEVTNPTPYYMNFISVSVDGHPLPEVTYVPPLSTKKFSLGAIQSARNVSWKIINDFGGTGPVHHQLINHR